MNHFKLIADGIDVAPLRAQIEAHPEIWNVHTNRTGFEGSPFVGTADAWIRYRPITELITAENFREPHWPEFYPAWYTLTELKPIVFSIMAKVEACHLGGILLTRIPSGGRILPHDDQQSWHARHYSTKVYVPIISNPQCVNFCEDESLVMEPGCAWEFDNLKTHSVENFGESDRITAIICMRQ